MIVDMSNGDILDQPLSNIVYEVDIFGVNPGAFVVEPVIPGREDTGAVQEKYEVMVGKVFSYGGVQPATGLYKTFHSIVTIGSDGYSDTDALTRGLDLIALRNSVKRAAVLITANRMGSLGAVARSRIEAVVYLPGSP